MARRRQSEADTAGASLLALAGREPPTTGLGWGLHIHRHHPSKEWREALGRVPEEHRAGAEEYLRGIADRMRAQLNMARAAGFHSVDAWKAAKAKR